MTKDNKKSMQTYLGFNAEVLLYELSQGLMLSKSAVIRLALRKLHTSSKHDIEGEVTKRL